MRLAQPPQSARGQGHAAMPWRSFAYRRTRSCDIEEHTSQLQDWHLKYDQLDAGRFDGEFIDIRLPGLQIFMESTSRRVRQSGELMADSLGVGTMLRGNGRLGMDGIRCEADSLLVCNASELDMCTPPDCLFAGVVLDTALLSQVAQSLGGMEIHFHRGSVLAMTPPREVLARWRQLLLDAVESAMAGDAGGNPSVAHQRLQDDLLLTLIEAMTCAAHEDRVQRPDHRKRMVDRACELMLSQPDDPPSLLDICQRVGASPRKLGYCFQDTFGVSPARYLKTIRLNAVRRELSTAGQPVASVYDAAARWGFWHFGHFSTDYKKLFAELPSETLMRSRGHRVA